MMMKPRNPRAVSSLMLTVSLGFLVLALFSCKNPTGPDQDTQPYINVRNGSGIDLDIYMDGTFQFSLYNNEYYLIENVAPGEHLLEAKRMDTDILVKSFTVETTAEFGYTWTITSDATLKVTNNYGETLDIYGDGTFQSDIADQAEIIAAHFPYGEHFIEAKKSGGTTVVASITIEVLEDIMYTWVIQK
jgi:hypothetical protein